MIEFEIKNLKCKKVIHLMNLKKRYISVFKNKIIKYFK
jgi:hypothetical protein